MRRYIVAGNWKMHRTRDEAVNLAVAILSRVADAHSVEVVLCPPFTALHPVGEVLQGTGLCLGAQNMHAEEEGAYTGEISPRMLTALGVSHVILGHSERRHYFSETDELINRKVISALAHGLVPILCVGETLEQREAGQTETVVSTQLDGGLEGVTISDPEALVIAYEPVWAIGTGRTATPEQAQEVHTFIRARLTHFFGAETVGKMRILYGGSVKPGNAAELMAQPDIEGALVGGASLDPDSFAAIVKSV